MSRIDETFANQPEQEGVIRVALGQLYRNLGQYKNAETLLRQGLKIQIYSQG